MYIYVYFWNNVIISGLNIGGKVYILNLYNIDILHHEIITWDFWLSTQVSQYCVFLFHNLNIDEGDTKCLNWFLKVSSCFRFGCREWVIDRRYIVDFGNLPFTTEINSRNSYVLFQFQIWNRFSRTFSRISSKCLTFDNNKGAFGISFDMVSIQEIIIKLQKKFLLLLY